MPPRPVSDPVRLALQKRAGADGCLRFDAFMETVLYHPECGYYRNRRIRIGRTGGTDFYTSASLGGVFGRLVARAAAALLPPDLPPRELTFVEIGAEAGRHILGDVDHPYGGLKSIGAGDPVVIPVRAVVFSNELFDAQPFRRFLLTEGGWRECGVALVSGGVTECLLASGKTDVPVDLPENAPLGYRVDLPTGARALAVSLAKRSWSGLFLAFDYGKTREALFAGHPEGTARAYHRHRQVSDILARAGDQDITCHICWEDIVEVLEARGFEEIRLERQEAFFMNRARDAIERILAEDADGVGADRRRLMEIIHPQYFGARFQVLSALRLSAPRASRAAGKK